MRKLYLIPCVLFIAGCSGSSTNNIVSETGGTAGNAGAAGDNTGGSTNTGGQAGMAGSINTGGMGGVAGSPNTGGTGGVCVPKTCDTYSYAKTGKTGLACGVISDGCGNVIDCGGCDDMYECGGDNVKTDYQLGDTINTTEETTLIGTGTTNICNGGCAFTNYGPAISACNTKPGTYPAMCPYEKPLTPDPITLEFKPSGSLYQCTHSVGYSKVWCCKAP